MAEAGKATVTAIFVRVDGGGAGDGGGCGGPSRERGCAAKLTEQQKVLHALNRFTFGPRPGDVAGGREDGAEGVV